MEMKQNQTFFDGIYSNLTPYLSLFQWLSKSEFLRFMTKVNPNNGNKQNQTFFDGIYSNLTPYLSLFQWLSKSEFLRFMTKVNLNNGNETN